MNFRVHRLTHPGKMGDGIKEEFLVDLVQLFVGVEMKKKRR